MPGPVQITATQVMQTDGRLNQTLIEKAERSPGFAPQVLPSLMSLKIPPGIEKIYSVSQKVCHAKNAGKLLRNLAKKRSVRVRTHNYTGPPRRQQPVCSNLSQQGSLLLQSHTHSVSFPQGLLRAASNSGIFIPAKYQLKAF